jgi:hypothetical protein
MVTDAIGVVQADFFPEQVNQADQLFFDTSLGSTKAPGLDYELCLRLVSEDDQIAESTCQHLGGEWESSKWNSGELVRGDGVILIDPFLAPGVYQVNGHLIETATGIEAGQVIDLGRLTVNALTRNFSEPDPEHEVDAQWETLITLLGYNLQQSDEELLLTLYWQADDRMSRSYKVFVHLIDETTGTIVAQNDSIPRQWGYPTTLWEREEVVDDTIVLPVGEIGPGSYRLQVGLYDPDTGNRLGVSTSNEKLYPDNVYPLTTLQR